MVKNKMGELPCFQFKPTVKAKTGDIRNMVLPGGGGLTTRVWSSMRVKVNALAKWQGKVLTTHRHAETAFKN